MSAHYYAYAQDVIEAIKNSGDEALDEYDLDKICLLNTSPIPRD